MFHVLHEWKMLRFRCSGISIRIKANINSNLRPNYLRIFARACNLQAFYGRLNVRKCLEIVANCKLQDTRKKLDICPSVQYICSLYSLVTNIIVPDLSYLEIKRDFILILFTSSNQNIMISFSITMITGHEILKNQTLNVN